ncbi:hypothetical protein [Stackebrandtia nassauensis]|uniref:Secreted protein n=1 Tax=Stackebrandtia nassauensis (strain DSM 44728 / CIP 108903 / NRRL B-16338 / NBRC 102104 / LLR-40K-21) TaxID=446470 RepID=D3PUP7_STANL|nr:hypothetical protein [Stackebrandtia nassauensis]ADD44921.1 hypothetical protein Snas_5287 [Stackebrandtia nassauensis DSM 44728]
MVRSKVAGILAATVVGVSAMVGSTALASADTADAKSCSGWSTLGTEYIRNIATGKVGGGIAYQERECPTSGGGTVDRYRTTMLIYAPLKSGTRAVAGIYGSKDDFCVVKPKESDRYCATDANVTGAYKSRGVVQKWSNGAWRTYAQGQWP